MKERVQADKAFEQGQDHLKTGIFKWNKDYVSAATSFDQAFKLYKKVGAYNECLKTLKQSLICNDKIKDPWAVARNHENILQIYLQKQTQLNISDEQLIQQTQICFNAFRIAQSTDKGLKLLSKTTKHLIKKNKVEEAIKLIKPNFEQSMEDPKVYNQTEVFNLIAEILIENNMYQQALKFYKGKIEKQKQTNKYLQSFGLSCIILHILKRELPEAESYNFELMNTIPNYSNSSQFEAAGNLINYYNERNQQKFKKQSTRPVVTALFPLIIIKKLRDFKLPIIQKGKEEEQKKLMEELLY